MAHRLYHMTDSRQSVTDEEIIKLLESGLRPVWTNSTIAEELGITRQTANRRLKQLEEDSEKVASIKVGRATAYYVPGVESLPPGDTIENRHRQSIIQWATDKFVGLETAPWTAVNPNDGPATEGDTLQILVEGQPRRWRLSRIHRAHNDNERREKLYDEEIIGNETQALVTGTLYEKPTVPIEHVNYPDEYDLEGKIGSQWKEIEGRGRKILIATGLKNYLIKPCNNAVFLKDVRVDWISVKGEGEETEVMTFDASGDSVESEMTDEEWDDLIDGVAERREENVEDDPDPI